MLTKTLITFAIAIALGISPWRDSKFVKFLIIITGG